MNETDPKLHDSPKDVVLGFIKRLSFTWLGLAVLSGMSGIDEGITLRVTFTGMAVAGLGLRAYVNQHWQSADQ